MADRGEVAAVRRSTPGPAVPRILFVSSHATLAGSERVLEDLLTTVPASSVADVVVLQDGPFVSRLRDLGLPVTVLATAASPAAVAVGVVRLARRLRAVRPDVVHANGVKAAVLSVLAGPRTPVVWMKHDVSLDGRQGRLVARRCAAVAGVSAEVGRGVAGSGRSVVVHPGVRVDVEQAGREGAAMRRRLGLQGPLVSVVGRLDPAKGHAELLEAMPDVLRAVPDVTALLVGGDDPQHPGHREALRRRAEELGVAGAVVLLGHEPAQAVLAVSRAVCVPTVPRADGSGREGFGLVAAEALALGVPVVGYDVGATGEVLAGCGELVAAGDRAALAGRLVAVLTDDALTERLSRCGRERATALTVERMTEQMLALYRQAAA